MGDNFLKSKLATSTKLSKVRVAQSNHKLLANFFLDDEEVPEPRSIKLTPVQPTSLTLPEEDELEMLVLNKGSYYSVLSRQLFEECKIMEANWKNKE